MKSGQNKIQFFAKNTEKDHTPHNAPPRVVPHGGSSIFFHIWRRDGAAATAGCTTMHEDRLRQIIATVDPSRHPLYVLLASAEYKKLKPVWKLP